MFKNTMVIVAFGLVFVCGYAAHGHLSDWLLAVFHAGPLDQVSMIFSAVFSTATMTLALVLTVLFYVVFLMLMVAVLSELWYNLFQRKVLKLIVNSWVSRKLFDREQDQERAPINMRLVWEEEQRKRAAARHESNKEDQERRSKHRERVDRIRQRQSATENIEITSMTPEDIAELEADHAGAVHIISLEQDVQRRIKQIRENAATEITAASGNTSRVKKIQQLADRMIEEQQSRLERAEADDI